MRSFLAIVAAALATTAWGLTIPPVPLSVQQSAPPLVMLVSGKDHRLFYEAYNDASDIDGDGTLDVRFKPGITYLGLFNSGYCYIHSGAGQLSGLFTPSKVTADGRCPGQWSGNWLNYITTSRIDALRVVLYGGMREVDTATQTVLRRAYIPQDAHSWAKEYTSESVDGYRISDYTPLAAPDFNKRHLFGNFTKTNDVDCTKLSACSDLAPWLSVMRNSTARVWEWASNERDKILGNAIDGERNNYTVRVQACSGTYTQGCKQYPNETYKPVGLLHEYGESGSMLFGLLTGSYDNSMAGGRLRKVTSSFSNEVDAQTGQFTGFAGIVRSYDAMRIRDHNNNESVKNVYRSGTLTNRAPNPGEFADWGNPIGEMMYESLRYFAGKRQPTAEFASGGRAMDDSVGLPAPAWDDPFDKINSAAKAPLCARANMLVISDTNVSYDSDQLPGSYFGPGITGDLPGLDVQAEAYRITALEPDALGLRFIGQSGSLADRAPTAKQVGSLGTVRGLAPEEPTKEGSYYAAAVAAYGKRTDLRSDDAGRQTVDTFVVALASPLPRIVAPLPGGRAVTLVPFAKSVWGMKANKIDNTKGQYQPTNQIVDFYVESIANSSTADRDSSVNGGRYQARFRIAFEDIEQGGDHDMDVFVEYTVTVNPDDSVSVTLRPIYQAGHILHRIGYVISGTDADGVYLEVQDELPLDDGGKVVDIPYFLNTPKGRKPGFCDANLTHPECKRLPYWPGSQASTADPVGHSATRTFRAASRPGATLLKDPLWYAAKWGGFVDGNENGRPDQRAEWDLDGDGLPDNYAPVLQPLKLRQALRNTFDGILRQTSSASNVAINSTAVGSDSVVYQAIFNSTDWSGDLLAYGVGEKGVVPTPNWSASAAVPRWDLRNIFIRDSESGTRKVDGFSSLPAADKTLLKSRAVLDYLRGDVSGQVRNGGTLRNRAGVLGDIAHSSPVHERTENVLYVGGNDGMLHAFDPAARGKELFAFIPRQSVPRLARLSEPAYRHEYFVDGDIVVAPRSDLTDQRLLLYALLGRGGKGLFSLDVSQPRAFERTHFRWEYTPEASAAARADPDLGLMLGRPLVVRLNNGKLGVIAGNGYNSTSGVATLYIFSIAKDGSLEAVHKLSASEPADGSKAAPAENGLAGPAAVDTDNNGTADLVFAGDLLGNVWRFDIKAANPHAWKVDHGSRPVFTARGPGEKAPPQPITANMHVARKPPAATGVDDPHAGRLFAFFGTGAYFRDTDPRDMSVQTWWGVLADGPTPIANRNALKQRTITQRGTNTRGTDSRTFSAATQRDMAQSSGWFIDFTNPVAGERIVTESRVVDVGVPVLLATSLYPVASDPCAPSGKGYLNILDPFTGAGIDADVLDANGDGTAEDDRLKERSIGSIDLGVGVPTQAQVISKPRGGSLILVGGSGEESGEDDKGSTAKGNRMIGDVSTLGPATKNFKFRGRLAWREVVKE